MKEFIIIIKASWQFPTIKPSLTRAYWEGIYVDPRKDLARNHKKVSNYERNEILR